MVRCAFLLFGFALAACSDESSTYHLFRTSAVEGMELKPIFVASFNAMEGGWYNRENCMIAAKLFQDQPGVIVKYWCEPSNLPW